MRICMRLPACALHWQVSAPVGEARYAREGRSVSFKGTCRPIPRLAPKTTATPVLGVTAIVQHCSVCSCTGALNSTTAYASQNLPTSDFSAMWRGTCLALYPSDFGVFAEAPGVHCAYMAASCPLAL